MPASKAQPAAKDPRSRLRWKRLLWLVALGLVAWLFWFWPARRNYYFRGERVTRRLDVPYESGEVDPKAECARANWIRELLVAHK